MRVRAFGVSPEVGMIQLASKDDLMLVDKRCFEEIEISHTRSFEPSEVGDCGNQASDGAAAGDGVINR